MEFVFNNIDLKFDFSQFLKNAFNINIVLDFDFVINIKIINVFFKNIINMMLKRDEFII